MLLVKTKIALSNIKNAGIGLFADEFIPAEKLIWSFNPTIDRKISIEELNNMNEFEKTFVKKYAYKEGSDYILCVDDGRFMNHSDSPNTSETKTHTAASKDINIGEEITCNYYVFDEDAKNKLKLDNSKL